MPWDGLTVSYAAEHGSLENMDWIKTGVSLNASFIYNWHPVRENPWSCKEHAADDVLRKKGSCAMCIMIQVKRIGDIIIIV